MTPPVSARPAVWRTVLSIPYGSARGELGYREIRGLIPLVPSAFVVDRQGYWILDPVKFRVVRFDRAGHVRRVVRGISDVALDLARDRDGSLLVIDQVDRDRNSDLGLRRIVGGRVVASVPNRDGPGVLPINFETTPVGVALRTPRGSYAVPRSLRIDQDVEGTPIGGDERIHVRMTGENRMLIRFGSRWTRRIVFAHGPGRPIIVSFWTLSVTRRHIAMWLFAGSLNTRGARWDGDFFLQLDTSGRVTAFEHVAGDASHDDNHTRNLFASDGGVWQLWLGTDHAEIRRR